MLEEKIHSLIEILKSWWQSAPLLVSEDTACTILQAIFFIECTSLREIEDKGIADFFWYDCAQKSSKNHGVEKIREYTQKLYQTPGWDISVALFLNIDALTHNAHNALLKIFEDVPERLLILVTSQAPEKIIPTLQSRIITINANTIQRWENPLQESIDSFVAGRPESLFNLTLDKEFKKEQALWVVTWLQNAILNGTLSPRNAQYIRETRLALETTNTIAKYLIDKLLIELLCE